MSQSAIARAAIFVSGIFYAFSGLGLMFAPEWFFQNIGNYPPFNRHYAGDTGAFTLALGITLLWAARNPTQHRSLIGYTILASLLHALNHAYDDYLVRQTLATVMMNTVPLFVFVVMLVVVYVVVGQSNPTQRKV
jgi:uncharacterized membrane protein